MRYNQQDSQDRDALERLECLSDDQLAAFDRLRPLDLRHYLSEQRPWLEDEIYFLGIALHRPPTEAEIAEIILGERHSQRFRAFYALRFPGAVAAAGN
jgi:hypothetical protein